MLVDRLLKANREDPDLAVYRKKAEQGGNWTTMDGLTLYKGRLIVPDRDHLRTQVIQEAHSRLVTAHPGRNKSRQLVATRYWWPKLSADVDRFVANCVTCRSSKAPRDKTPGLLHPLPVPRVRQHLVVASSPCRRTRRATTTHWSSWTASASWVTPCTVHATAKDAARMYFEGPYRVFGLPQTVVSDRGPQFVASFTDELAKILGVTWHLATAGHSQTAGQAEIMNEYFQQRIRPYLNRFQKNWSKAVPAMDAVQASLPHESTGLSPHEVEMGFPMPLHFDWEQRTQELRKLPPKERVDREDTQRTAQTIQAYVEYARHTMSASQDKMSAQANLHRREPDFDVGDRVFIVKKVWTTDRPSDKLVYPLTRNHYRIQARERHSYRLEVPDSWRSTRVFTADRLRKYLNNPLPGQDFERPDGDEVEPGSDETEWEVEKVLSSRLYYRKLQYQVEWRGWDNDPEWYDAANLKNAPERLREYHDANPDMPGPRKRLKAWIKAAEEERIDPPHSDDNKPAAGSTTTQTRHGYKRT